MSNITNEEQARMLELHKLLNEASKAYYANDEEIISNFEYDKLYDELVALEEKTGVVLSGSPTTNVGYEAVDSLPKEKHASPMLSLAKTKSRDELADWLGAYETRRLNHCPDIRKRRTFQSRDERKRRGWRNYYAECKDVYESPFKNRV